MNILDKIINYINGAQVQSAAFSGSLPTATVKKGSKGENVKRVQRFLNWCINAKLKVDGKCGSKTVSAIKKFQKKYKLKVDGIFGTQCRRKMSSIINPPKPAPKPASTTAQILVAKAKELAWAKGTASSKYKWKGGNPTAAFTTALKRYYPDRSGWGKAPRVGCSCDVFVGTVLRASGLEPKVPRGLKGQYPYKPTKFTRKVYKNVTPYSVSKDGDVVLYKKSKGGGHILIRGNGVIYEAGFENSYGHVQTSLKKLKTKRPYVVIWRAK